ncbi:hypothetical protein BCY84_06311 [Trypanosoma cruzi cruzi]|nr:hypothetical protein BCY84_06311 [Trypanosoma cruzi cruzi]
MSMDALTDVSKTTAQRDRSVAATYTPEEQVFHRLFHQIPLSEKLVESRQCALLTKKKKFARMGTLYASSLRLCFSSSFLKEPVMMRWEDVISVKKGTSFLFEAIFVKTKGQEEYIFSGFLSGGTGQTFKLLKTLWTVRARYAFSETPTQLPQASQIDSPLKEPGSGSFHSSEASSCINDEITGKNEDEKPIITLAPLLKPTHSEFNLFNPTSGFGTNDLDSTEFSVATQDTEEKTRGSYIPRTSSTPKGALLEKFDELNSFSKVPKSEPLIDYFQCSYVCGVHRIGRLYITTNYILFSSVMMTESLQISFRDVQSIEKEQTMMILDGVVIKLIDNETHSFTSFVSRDAAFNILTHFFNVTKTLSTQPQNLPHSLQENCTNSGFITKTSEPNVSGFPVVDSLQEFSKVLTDYGTAFSAFSCFTRELIEPIVLPKGKTVLDVFKVCFDDNASLLEEYHRDRKDSNQKWEPWRPAQTGSPQFSGQRVFTCTTTIKALVSKSCPFTEYQRYAFMNVGGHEPTLVVQLSGQAEGLMYADAFRAEALLVFTQSDSGVAMRVFGYIQFLRDVWVKGKILRTSLDNEMPICYRKLGSMLIERLQQEGGISGAEGPEKSSTELTSSCAKAVSGTPLDKALLPRERALQWGRVVLGLLGLMTCLGGFFSVFLMRFDSNAHLKRGASKENVLMVHLVSTFFEFLQPTVISVLVVGILAFYRLATDALFLTE